MQRESKGRGQECETVSVIVTNHNYREFVAEAVRSAIAQTHRPHELIVVDDGSTDGSPEFLAREFVGNDAVKLVLTQNEGQLAAFQKGFQVCSGDVVSFLDADDLWDPAHLGQAIQTLHAKPHVDVVFSNLQLFGKGDGRWSPLKHDRDFGFDILSTYFLQARPHAPTSALSMRRWVCAEILSLPKDFWPEWKTRADDCLVYGSGVLGAHKYFLADPTVRYRVHEKNRWMGRKEHLSDALRHVWRVRRVIEHFWRKILGGEITAMSVILEFKSKEAPSFQELLSYVRILRKVPLAMTMRLRQTGAMFWYYLRTLLGAR
jgi:glycosyltransferase involved in cell wall biosynthesis